MEYDIADPRNLEHSSSLFNYAYGMLRKADRGFEEPWREAWKGKVRPETYFILTFFITLSALLDPYRMYVFQDLEIACLFMPKNVCEMVVDVPTTLQDVNHCGNLCVTEVAFRLQYVRAGIGGPS